MSQETGKRISSFRKKFRSQNFECAKFFLIFFAESLVSHLKKVSNIVVVEQKLLGVRLIAAVVNVLVEVSLQSQERFSDHAGVVGVEFDSFDQNTSEKIH